MKLPSIPTSKISLLTLAAGILAGATIAGVSIAHQGNTVRTIEKTSSVDTAAPTDSTAPVAADPSTDPAPASDTSTTPQSPILTTGGSQPATSTKQPVGTTSTVQNSTSPVASNPAPTAPAPVVLTGSSQRHEDDGTTTTYYCDYNYSDGSTTEKIAGAVPSLYAKNSSFSC